MKYLALIPVAILFSSCGIMEALTPDVTVLTTPEVQAQVKEVADSWMSGRFVDGLTGAATLVGLIWGKKKLDAVKASEPGKFV